MTDLKRAKFFQILDALWDPNIHLANDCYLELLITHLSGGKAGEKSEYRDFLRAPKVLEWIEGSVERWAEGKMRDTSILAFTLKLTALVVENEWQFSLIKEKQILERIQEVITQNPSLQTPSVQLANVLLLKSVCQHTMGLFWIQQKGVWQLVLDYCEKNHTVYVVRESLGFIYSILIKFSDIVDDKEICEAILNKICLPIMLDNPFKELELNASQIEVRVDDEEKISRIIPSLNIICHILQNVIQKNEGHELAKIMVIKMNLEHFLWGLADISHNSIFISAIMRSHILINFTRAVLRRKEPDHTPGDFGKFGVDYFNYMNFCIARRSSINIIIMAELYHRIWNQVTPPAPKEVVMEGEHIKFEDQLVILQILPILYIVKSGTTHESQAECLDSYIIKLFNICCERTIRLCYSFRDLLHSCSDEAIASLATKSIQTLVGMKDTMNRERAVLVLQALVYTLQESEPGLGPKKNIDLLLDTPNLLSAILTGMHSLIKFYKITWKECIESTVLVNFMLDLLSNPNISVRHAVQALQLIQLSIEHFLAPNLALLMDTLQGSGMETLGPVIYRKLHDNAWEIRDSALELLTSMVSISEMKFPPFQKHILESDICPIVWTVAKNDGESYVRASALSCITQMVGIALFWESNLASQDIIAYLLDSLYTETEGVVRKEGVRLLSTIYRLRKVPLMHMDHLFSIMAYCAVNDLYWEVKTEALCFWINVMCRQFEHQGVIDNTFPSVTFSKEHRKIVNLTEKEIFLRLTKILNELSVRGCLGVFQRCLNDSSDIEVVKKTACILAKLKTFLDKYNYSQNINNITSTDGAVMDTNFIRDHAKIQINRAANGMSSRNDADVLTKGPDLDSNMVIDSIVDAQDVNLLASAYQNQMRVDGGAKAKSGKDSFNKNYYQEFTATTAEEFLQILNTVDMETLVATKCDWLSHFETLDSLLDDILLSCRKVPDVNDADCY